MGPKRSTPLDDPPSASSDDEETEDEQEQVKAAQETNEESESEEEEESEEETINPVKLPFEKSSSEEELESESEEEEIATSVKASVENSKTLIPKSFSISESESEFRSPTASDFAIKPSKKISAVESPEMTPNSKRSSESDMNSKKKLKVSNGDIDEEKKSVIKRVWSDDDEILLLQGFIDYQCKKGYSPLSDIDGFYRFIMVSLPGNASKSQLYDKIRRLKKKYRVNSEKGENPVFSKPHESKLFELSKKIWGIGGTESLNVSGGFNSRSKSKPKIEVKEEEEEEDDDDETMVEMQDFETLYPHWNAGLKSEVSSSFSFPNGVSTFLKKNWSLIGEDKAREMDGKWKAHFENETVLRVTKVALLGQVGEVVATALGK